MTNKQLTVLNNKITIDFGEEDYISLTDIAKYKEGDSRSIVTIANWLRTMQTLEFLGAWEVINNPDFKPLKFEDFKKQAGSDKFGVSPQQWIKETPHFHRASDQRCYL